jgi:hypothetical protein
MPIFSLSRLSRPPFTIFNDSIAAATSRYFNMSDAILNEVLANITISALTLDTWHDVVDGMDTRVFNVYHFQRYLNFFLPYGLCLLFTLPIVAMGLLALRHNGVSAIDGGFLQILMTAATGRTEVELAAQKSSLGGYESVPNDLKKLKVRFGELLALQQTPRLAKIPDTTLAPAETAYRDVDLNESGEDIALMRVSQERGAAGDRGLAAGVVSGVEAHDASVMPLRRAGFGTASETKPLRRGDKLDSG